MLARLAEAYDVPFTETLTGFKHLARAGDDLVYAYEEALGVAASPATVRDKDGISAALLVAELAALERARGRTLLDRLADLEARFGRHETRQLSYRVADLSLIARGGRLAAGVTAHGLRRVRGHGGRAAGRRRAGAPAAPAGGWSSGRAAPSPSSRPTSSSSTHRPGAMDALAEAVDARLGLG